MRLEVCEAVDLEGDKLVTTIIYNGQEMKRWGRKEYL
jgi:hypothetical protein